MITFTICLVLRAPRFHVLLFRSQPMCLQVSACLFILVGGVESFDTSYNSLHSTHEEFMMPSS